MTYICQRIRTLKPEMVLTAPIIQHLTQLAESYAMRNPSNYRDLTISEFVRNRTQQSVEAIRELQQEMKQNNDDAFRMALLNNTGDARDILSQIANHPVSVSIQQPTQSANKVYTIAIDSRYRDVLAYPNANNYRALLDSSGRTVNTEIGNGNVSNINMPRNIISIELLRCIIPNVYISGASITTPTLFVSVSELLGNVYSMGAGASSYIAVITPEAAINTSFPYLPVKFSDSIITFDPPLSSLNKLTLSITNASGTPYNFGTTSSTVSSVSAASPAVITTAAAHNLSSGDRVIITGTTGTVNDTSLNSPDGHQVQVLTATTFSINLDLSAGSAGSGGYVLPIALQNTFIFKITCR
jgi:hypothetical protein